MRKTLIFSSVVFAILLFGVSCYANQYETEPNNDKDQADVLVSGESIIGQNSSYENEDWYSICVSGSDVIDVNFETVRYSYAEWAISIKDTSENVLSKTRHDAAASASTNIFAAVTEPGLYYIVVKSSYSYNYTLTASVSTPCTGAPTEPGNSADYEAGRQACIDDPASCGIIPSECEECPVSLIQTDIDAAKEAGRQQCIKDPSSCGIETGAGSPTTDGNCASFDLFTNLLHVPCLDMGTASYWLDLRLQGDTLEIKEYDLNQ